MVWSKESAYFFPISTFIEDYSSSLLYIVIFIIIDSMFVSLQNSYVEVPMWWYLETDPLRVN